MARAFTPCSLQGVFCAAHLKAVRNCWQGVVLRLLEEFLEKAEHNGSLQSDEVSYH